MSDKVRVACRVRHYTLKRFELAPIEKPVKALNEARLNFQRSRKEYDASLYAAMQTALHVALTLDAEKSQWTRFRVDPFWGVKQPKAEKPKFERSCA